MVGYIRSEICSVVGPSRQSMVKDFGNFAIVKKHLT